jgi:DNA helicase-2/ATP-dependent DNA helicase PcrA
MPHHGEIPGLNRKTRAGIEQFLRIWTGLRECPDSPVAELVRKAVELSGYDEYLAASDTDRDEERRENVSELIGAAAEYDRRHPDGSLREFLEEVALLSQVDRWESDEPRVTLMTMHAAKGLEFPIVFIVGLEEGILPHHRSIDSSEEIEEERRLFHVGMTRAKERLVLLHAAARAQFGLAQPCVPSRFLEELPEDAVERENKTGWTAIDFGPIVEGFSEEIEEAIPEEFAAGDCVKHPLLGIGTVVSVSGIGSQRRIVVRFRNGDERKFILEFAKLCKIQ